MPIFHNISDMLEFVGGDARFLPIALPHGFNHWAEGYRQLREDNPEFFEGRELDQVDETLGVIASKDSNGQDVVRGFMAMCKGSRYVCTNWKVRQGVPTSVQQVDLLGVAVRKGLVTILKVKV